MSEITDRLWERFGSLTVDDLPPQVEQAAHQCVLDWYACTIAGTAEPLAQMLRDELGEVDGPASIVGTTETTGVYQAAMINGATGHALDFDDTQMVMGGHPTAPMYPAILALAEMDGRSGSDLLTAFVVGTEIESQIGTAIGPEHYAKGWHVTSTMGVFGAAAGAAWLLGLDAEQFGHAMGLAASNAAGLKANFGTMTKPYHAGHAAERGLLAARLAARGYTANSAAIEGKQGLAEAAGTGSLRMGKFDRWADAWAIERTLFKYHAACYLTHSGIEATAAAMADAKASGADVEAITLTVHPSLLDICGQPSPTTGLGAKFSLRATQSFVVNGINTSAVESYDDGPINQAPVQSFIDCVTVETDDSLPTTASRVALLTREGTAEASYDAGIPATDLDAQGIKLRSKFDALTGSVMTSDSSAQLAATLGNLRAIQDVRSIAAT